MLQTSISHNPQKRWLSTHKWHSKRFLMKTTWEYVLPHRNRSYGMRFVWTKLKTGSVIHDLSYIQPIVIQGDMKSIIYALEQLTVVDFYLP